MVVYLVHEQQNSSIREMRKGVERDKERIEAKKRNKALADAATQSSSS